MFLPNRSAAKSFYKLSSVALSFLLIFLLPLLLVGCKQACHVEVNNNSSMTIVVFHYVVGDNQKTNIGSVAANNVLKPPYGLLAGDQLTVLEVQNTSGKPLGEVRQSREEVHQHTIDGVWKVNVPQDFTSVDKEVLNQK